MTLFSAQMILIRQKNRRARRRFYLAVRGEICGRMLLCVVAVIEKMHASFRATEKEFSYRGESNCSSFRIVSMKPRIFGSLSSEFFVSNSRAR